MSKLRNLYRDRVAAVLDRALGEQGEALDAVRDAVAEALAADRLIYVAGSGHSHMLAEEVFYRAGGAAAVQAVLDPDLMLHLGAERSTRIEREEGRADKVLAGYPVGPGDVVFIASNSGRNAYPIELALAAKARGATTVALTSRRHAEATPSRHPSGKRLHELTDFVLDNGGEHGDATLPIPGRDVAMGPTSTIAGAFLLNAVMAEAVAKLAEAGILVDVFRSANTEGPPGEMEAILARWRPRIKGL